MFFPILSALFVLTGLVHVMNAASVPNLGDTCTALDTCAVSGAICSAATTGGTLSCNCDTSKHLVQTTGGANTCECGTGYTGTVPTCLGKVGTTCALNADCLANGHCGSNLKCACYPTYTGASGAATCVALACSNGATDCTGVDGNSQCTSGGTCECKTNYGIFSSGTKATCQPGVGATCTSSGGECGNLPGGYCNTATSTAVCACGVIYTAAATACTTKVCEPGSTTCSTLDANSECGKGYCVCKSGLTIGSDGKCKLLNGTPPESEAPAVAMSMFLTAAILLASRML
ncbi:fibropellin-1-like isoform X2 [Dreissena polymorpha]|uniref:fibropellin-1-like isoform X2 n=1 Tax=Dreissena polymorpha TaxID=45954 RepID=UPI002264617D|nr:fibropellin-1-like isoform X2 [Dreissena polymorpha]